MNSKKTKKQLQFLISFSIFLLTFSSLAQKTLDELLELHNTRNISYISVEELRMLQLNEKVLVFDAREKEEFAVSHIPSANFIGYSSFSEELFPEKNKNAPIVIYCSLGIRSEKIAEKLTKAGFTNVQNLYGGIFEWKNKGYPVLDSLGIETQKVHAFSKNWDKWLTRGIKIYD